MNGSAQIASPAAALRVFRFMKAAFLVYGILLIYVIIKIRPKSSSPEDSTMVVAITFLAPIMLVLGFFTPRFFPRLAQRSSQSAPGATPIKQWFSGGLIGLCFLEACSLFGVVLHFLGAGLRQSELLIGAGIAAIAFFSPGALPGSEEGNSSQS